MAQKSVKNMSEEQLTAREFFQTATNPELDEFITRNGYGEVITYNPASVWCKGAEFAKPLGFDECYHKNTKKNAKRGNWYIKRNH